MAQRPIFTPSTEGSALVTTHSVEFTWFPGMAISQSQKSVASLHNNACDQLRLEKVLEISSKSPIEEGVQLSAFNLMITTAKYGQKFSLECAYQASKVFERGGPFTDILQKRSIEAKKDARLTQHGRLVGFRFFKTDWPLTPRTAFYDWLYINALHKNERLSDFVLKYRAFSDIAFNPERSINCQAYAAALYVSLHERGLLSPSILKSKDRYLELVGGREVSNAHENTVVQSSIAMD